MSDDHAPGLPDRAAFTLLHCGQPMRFRGSVTQQRGTGSDLSETTSCRYACDDCAATLELHLTEHGAAT
jgi:hypothetical protein